MSKVGKQIINIPEKVEVKFENGVFSVKGEKGSLSKQFLPIIEVKIADGNVTLHPTNEEVFTRSLWGTYASHVKNMIQGVVSEFQKKLILEGVGFKSEVSGKDLVLALGFSHPVKVAIPEGLTVTAEKNLITVRGIDKEKVGEFTAKLRSLKKPEPYKGKGFRYDDEIIKRKQGKKTA